jgi:hypothetical protein
MLQPELPPVNVALPTAPPRACRLILTRRADGACALDVQLDNVSADALLRYAGSGHMKQAAAVGASDAMRSEELLFSKMADPIAAAVGAYALLRMGELERLHEWTENLRQFFPWLPDGTTIRAEHLARYGRHGEALTALLELPQRGLPFFTDGLTYAIDRLRLYVGAGTSAFDPQQLEPARALLERLQSYAAFVDFQRPVLTFTGLDPNAPDARALDQDLDAYDGVDVSEYVGLASQPA